MKRNNKLILAVATVMLTAGPIYQAQAVAASKAGLAANDYAPNEDKTNTSDNAQPRYNVSNRNYPPSAVRGNPEQHRQYNPDRQRYGGPGGYNRGYPPRPYYGDRNYRRSDSRMPWESRRGSSKMPWESKRGGSRMPWESKRGGRDNWFSKDKFSDAWDDMLNAPSDMGEMPGGWTAPSVSMPNPVDVGDEFENAARDAPEQMRDVYDDNRRPNRYDDYRRPNRYDDYRRPNRYR